MKCKVCGTEFVPDAKNRYTAVNLGVLLNKDVWYDCFDCPTCGCQIRAGERFLTASENPAVIEEVDTEEDHTKN